MYKTNAAVLYNSNEPLKIETLEQEGPKHGEVRIKVSVAGICASDLHYMIGDLPMPMPVVTQHPIKAATSIGTSSGILYKDC